MCPLPLKQSLPAEKGTLAGQADIYHCTWNEIFPILKGEWDGRGLDVLAAERKARMKEMEALTAPDFINVTVDQVGGGRCVLIQELIRIVRRCNYKRCAIIVLLYHNLLIL